MRKIYFVVTLVTFSLLCFNSIYCQNHNFACADYTQGKVFIIQKDSVAWEFPAPNSNDLWLLANGNILFTTGKGVLELTRAKDTVFHYESTSEIYACQRLGNGNTFIGECNAGRLLELTPSGKMVKEIKILPDSIKGSHSFMRNARALKNGNYLVTLFGQKLVREYDQSGKIVWEVKAPGGPHSVIRLPSGNTMVSVGDADKNPKILEFNKNGEIVWEISNADLPEKPFRSLGGMQKLPNGNILVCNWLGHNQYGTTAPHLLEITPDKKIVWTFTNEKYMRTMSTIFMLDENGLPLYEQTLH